MKLRKYDINGRPVYNIILQGRKNNEIAYNYMPHPNETRQHIAWQLRKMRNELRNFPNERR